MKILLAITFVFGVIRLLTTTKIFDSKMNHILTCIGFNNDYKIIASLEVLFYIFCLCFQAWYWLFQK